MAAAQYVHVPGYAALLFRETFPDLSQPDALIPRSKAWWSNKARWHEQQKRWTFPSGATITFGHLSRDDEVYQYQGAAYQLIAGDELTQHTEFRYRYLFSRLRRPETGPLSQVPLRMRGASNPGGKGHDWVKARFIDPKTRKPGAVFVPALLADNPSLDAQAYRSSLEHLDPLTRQQLLAGDWDAVASGRFKRDWLRFWQPHGTGFCLDGKYHLVGDVVCRFLTVDPAASLSDAADWTVISAWALLKSGDLLWLDMVRGHWEVPDIPSHVAGMFGRHSCVEVCIEGGGTQKGVVQLCQRHPRLGPSRVREVSPEGKDKLVRATPAINLCAAGRVWLPSSSLPWIDDALGEMLRFTGDPKQDAHDDIVDTLAYAALVCRHYSDGQANSFRPYLAPSNQGAYQ